MGPAAHHQQPRPWVAVQKPSRCLQQEIEAAVSLDPGDDSDHQVLRCEAEGRAELRVRRLRGETLGVHGPEDAAQRPTTAKDPVALCRLRRDAEQPIGSRPEQPAVPGKPGDLLGLPVGAHQGRHSPASACARRPQRQQMVPRVPGVNDVDLVMLEEGVKRLDFAPVGQGPEPAAPQDGELGQ